MMNRLPLVIYGPQACGKTRNAERLKRAFGARRVVDEWVPGDPLPPDAIALTNCDGDELPPRRSISFSDAMKVVNAGRKTPPW